MGFGWLTAWEREKLEATLREMFDGPRAWQRIPAVECTSQTVAIATRITGLCWAAPLREDAHRPYFVSGPSTVDFWNPARHGLTVVCVSRPKLFRQRPLFIQNHQQVNTYPKHRGVAQEPPGPKQQALAQQDHH